MALRKIRTMGDPILEKTCRPVKEITPRIKMLVDDMFDTMYNEYGVGLAANQVGILKRIVVIDVGLEERDPHVFINPEILETEGEQTGNEGCLSVPGKCGTVTRPQKVKVAALDINGNRFEMEVEDLFARAVCHECDHLDGKIYVSLVEGDLRDVTAEDEEEEDAVEAEGGKETEPGAKAED